ncbi:MAG: hypothetical protein LBR07_04870, partial [Puniceicoccales bacterium]|nr:hypothetical protein [Puniceicoccales bacterium]
MSFFRRLSRPAGNGVLPRIAPLCAAATALLSMFATGAGAAAAVPVKAVPVELVTVSADSEHGGYEAWRALDGDLRTMWHSDFSSA